MTRLAARLGPLLGGGFGRRIGVMLLALGLVFTQVVPGRSGAALGPVRSITPAEVTSNGFVGNVYEPVMSFRGEVAGIHDREVREAAFVQLDIGGPDPMVGGWGMAVSGDGCVGLTVQIRPGGVTAVFRDHVISDRCRGLTRAIAPAGSAYDPENSLALSHTGRFAAVQFHNTDDVGPRSNVLRIDTETLAQVSMPLPSGWFSEAEHGIDISDDGRYIAVPLSNFKEMEVAVWDVQTGDVSFVSAPTGPSGGWAAFPSISGDGNWVSFASSEPRGLGEVNIGPWVYVANRSSGAARLVSGAGDASYYSSISRDGSQVAYSVSDPAPPVITLPTFTFTLPTISFPIITIAPTTDPPIIFGFPEGTAPVCNYSRDILDDLEFDCPPSRVNVAYGPAPGLTGTLQIETVSLDANNRVIGQHWEPTLSGNGRWVAWVSDVGDALLGTSGGLNQFRHAFMRRRDPGLRITPVDFGTVNIDDPIVDRNAQVRNSGRTSVSLDSIIPPGSPFSISGGSCTTGQILPPGSSCLVRIRFRPNGVVGSWNSTLRVEEIGYDAISASGRIIGSSTTGSSIPPDTTVPEQGAGRPDLVAVPNPVDFGTIDKGSASSKRQIVVTNVGDGVAQVATSLDGPHPDEFFVAENKCADATLLPGDSCSMDVIFIPDGDGGRSATLRAASPLSAVDIDLRGIGVAIIQLEADPPAVDHGQVKVGFSSDDETVTITNTGNEAGVLNTTIDGPHRDDFFVRTNNCVNEELAPGQSCTIDIALFPRSGGNRRATLTVSSGAASVDVPLEGQGRFEPSLMASPEAVTERGITFFVGQGFPADQRFVIDIIDRDDNIADSVAVVSDDDGRFRELYQPFLVLDLGAYTLHVDGRPNVYDPIDEPLVIVLPTFQPQGPTGPAFNNNLLVARG